MIGAGCLNVTAVNECLLNDGRLVPETYRLKITAAIVPAVSHLWGVFTFYSGSFKRTVTVIGTPVSLWNKRSKPGGTWAERGRPGGSWREV